MTTERRWLPLLCVFLVVAGALAIRLVRLGDTSLDFDEYLHVFAGQRLLQHGRPLLPSGEPYTRALPYTRMVSQSIRWFGTSEAAVRLPSVVCGVGLVLLAGWIAWRWAGAGAAIVVMVLVALDPYCLQMSRVCRMYAPFHLLYLGVLYAAYEAFEGGGSLRRRFGWGAAALVALAASMKLHKLTVDLVAGVAGYVVVQATLTRQRKYWGLTVLGVAAGLAAAALGIVNLVGLWREANWAPAYAAPWRYDYGFYLRHFRAVDPWMVALAVPALIWWLWRDAKRGWYLACAIGVPFALHSLIFDWKEDRYLLHIVPVALLVIGAALWGWSEVLARTLARRREPDGQRPARRLTPWVAVLLLAPFGLRAMSGRSLSGLDGTVAKWREAYQTLRPLIRSGDGLVISVPLVSAYYLGRLPDYVVLNALVHDAGRDAVAGPDGFLLDWYSGRPLVTNAEEMERAFHRHTRGWIVIDRERFVAETCVPAAVRALIRSRCREWPMPDASVVVYSWGVG